jgi:hypothetical protein
VEFGARACVVGVEGPGWELKRAGSTQMRAKAAKSQRVRTIDATRNPPVAFPSSLAPLVEMAGLVKR